MEVMTAHSITSGLLEFLADLERKDLSGEAITKAKTHLLDTTRSFPEERGAVLIVTLTDGRSFQYTTDNPLGSPSKPIDFDQATEKFIALAKPVIGPGKCDRIVDLVCNL